MKSYGHILRRQHLASKVRESWLKCCTFDGVSPDCVHNTFSTCNPYLPEYRGRMREFIELLNGELPVC